MFSSDFLRRMEQLEIQTRRLHRGSQRGLRRSPHVGSSLEFADFRNYSPGDDLRSIDWNAYARLDRLYLKLFEEEEDLHVSLLIDSSSSMAWASGETSKLQLATQLAAALAHISLSHLDRVGVWFFNDHLRQHSGFLRGRRAIHSLLRFLAEPPASTAATSFEQSFQEYIHQVKPRGLIIVLSDFLDPAGYESGLRRLLGTHSEIALIQLLDTEELHPSLHGDVLLRDSETGQSQRLVASSELIRAYTQRLRDFSESLAAFGRQRCISVHSAHTHERFEDILLRRFRTGLLA